MRIATFSAAGGHPDNEDACRVEPHPGDGAVFLCTIADGQGGRAGGAAASALACETVFREAHAHQPADLLKSSGSVLSAAPWPTILTAADKAIHADAAAGFTTLIGFALDRRKISGASNGDSAVYLIDSMGTMELTSNQNKNPPIGSGSAAIVKFSAPLLPPWMVVAVTDGVWRYGGVDIINKLHPGVDEHTAIDELSNAVRTLGRFQDDVTIAVFRGE